MLMKDADSNSKSGADTLRKQVTHEKTLLNAMEVMEVLWTVTKGRGGTT